MMPQLKTEGKQCFTEARGKEKLKSLDSLELGLLSAWETGWKGRAEARERPGQTGTDRDGQTDRQRRC